MSDGEAEGVEALKIVVIIGEHRAELKSRIPRSHEVDLRSERENPALDLLPAAVVLARVVSRPRADVATCVAGSKSVAAEAGDPCAFVLGRPELEPLAPSEEHLPLRVRSGPAPARGTPLYLVPRHVCPTVNLAEEALLVDGGRVVGTEAVSARAHELSTRD